MLKVICRQPPRNYLRHEPQDCNRLDVCCLWKQIEPSQAFHNVFPLPFPLLVHGVLFRRQRHDLPDVPRLRVYITTHIYDRLRPERKQLPHKRIITALARRVYNERSALRREVADGIEYLRRVAGAERYLVRESVQLRVVRREADRVGRELDPGDFGEVRGECECEKAGATVGVYEVGWWWPIRGRRSWRGWEDGVANVGSERYEYGVVVLEERARLVIEEEFTDPFPDCRFVICDADVCVFGPQLCRRCR